jgi:hypothetical protein
MSKLSYDQRSVGQSGLVSGHNQEPANNFSFTSMEVNLEIGGGGLLLGGAFSDERTGL